LFKLEEKIQRSSSLHLKEKVVGTQHAHFKQTDIKRRNHNNSRNTILKKRAQLYLDHLIV
jgi:hypothetical protein